MSVYTKEPQTPAEACVIWLHGLGADASDMAGLAQELPPTSYALKHVFMDAPVRPVTINNGMSMRAWYDITGVELNNREDEQGIKASNQLIRDLINTQIEEGFASNKIFIAGFSQGGAMALYTALHSDIPLAGVISLSAYLPLANHCKPILDKNTPFFIGAGSKDPVVLPAWTQLSKQFLEMAGYKQMTWHQYPMEHSICMDEISDISLWFNQQVQRIR